MDVPWNGLGAIRENYTGTNLAPMQYRMFQVWFTKLFGNFCIKKYVLATGIALGFCLWAVNLYFSLMFVPIMAAFGTILVLLVILTTMVYDYMDKYFELGFCALSFYGWITGNLLLMVVVMLLSSLNKESSILQAGIPLMIPITAPFKQITASFILLIAWLIPYKYLRHRYGTRVNYALSCMPNARQVFFGVLTYPINIRYLKEKRYMEAIPNSFVILALTAISLLINPAFLFFALGYMVLITLTGSLAEPRIYLPLSMIYVPTLLQVML